MRPDSLGDEELDRLELERKRAEQVERAGFSKRFRDLTLDESLLPPAIATCASSWPTPANPSGGALLCGPTGTGKSIAGQWLALQAINRGLSAFRVTCHELAFALWKKDERKRSAARARSVFVLDDLGATHETSWVLSEIDALIDMRSDACLATIVTSNVAPWKRDAGDDSIEARYPRLWSRLREGGPGLVIVDGPDLRLRAPSSRR